MKEHLYYIALAECGVRYKLMLVRNYDEKLWDFTCEYTDACMKRSLPIPKLCRWLGFIQGVLIERGITTVEAERNWTRPLFKPLDFDTAGTSA